MKRLSYVLLCTFLMTSAHAFLGFGKKSNKAPSNIGHRVGAGKGEYHSDLPENSISALRAALLGRNGEQPIQMLHNFLYVEFDVQETADGHLVLFHDSKLTRMLPDRDENKAIYKELMEDPGVKRRVKKSRLKVRDLRVASLTLEQLQRLTLLGTEDESVPTLDNFLGKALEWGVRKPIISEIKKINTDEGRLKFIQTMAEFRSKINQSDMIHEYGYDLDPSSVGFLSFKGNFKKSYGKKKATRTYWCEIFEDYEFYRVYRARKHEYNICEM